MHNESDQRVQAVAPTGDDIMKIELPGAPAAVIGKAVAAQNALAHDFTLFDGALLIDVTMGNPLIVLGAMLTGIVFWKRFEAMSEVFEFGQGRKEQLHKI